jgi:hypothetical protein
LANGWYNPFWDPDNTDIDQDCCNKSSNLPSSFLHGPNSGSYSIYGLPSNENHLGGGGADSCVILVVKCDNYVYVMHFTVGQKLSKPFPFDGQSNCHAYICGASGGHGDPNYKSSRCLKKTIINAIKGSNVILDGVSSSSGCGWTNDKRGGWYDTINKPPQSTDTPIPDLYDGYNPSPIWNPVPQPLLFPSRIYGNFIKLHEKFITM